MDVPQMQFLLTPQITCVCVHGPYRLRGTIEPRHGDSRRKDIAETSSFAVCSEDKYIPNQLATQHEAPSDMFLVQSFNWLNFIQLCEDAREGWCTP